MLLPVCNNATGNPGTTVTTTSDASKVRFDRTVPTLNPVTISSDNTDTQKAKEGSKVTINFTSSEGITSVSAEIGGHAAILTPDLAGKVWTAEYTMLVTDNEGLQGINIAFQDSTGNIGTIVTSTSNGSSVVFDRTLPVLSNVAIVSNNPKTSQAKTGNEISLTFTSSEIIFTPNVTIEGHAATVTNISNNWTAKYTISGTEAEGTVDFTIDFKDLSYNSGTQVLATTNGSSVIIDNTTPNLTAVSISSNNSIANTKAKVGDIVTLTFTSSEGIKGVSATIDGKAATVTGDSNGTNWTGTYIMIGTDPEGNIPISIRHVPMSHIRG